MRIVAVDDPVDDVVRLCSFMKQSRDLLRGVCHAGERLGTLRVPTPLAELGEHASRATGCEGGSLRAGLPIRSIKYGGTAPGIRGGSRTHRALCASNRARSHREGGASR